MRFTLRGARLVDALNDLPHANLVVDNMHIQTVERTARAREEADGASGEQTVIDLTGMIVMPGFTDVHTHGGGGYNLHTTSADEIRAFADWAPSTGVTSFLIAVVGAPNELPTRQLHAAVAAIEERGMGAEPLGILLEGPYISAQRRGAHALSWLRTPNAAEIDTVLDVSHGHLRIIALAPELPGAEEMIRRMVEAGVTVSIGHTDATYDQTREAIQAGISHATHCYNAMRPLLHRDPGPLSAIFEAPGVYGEVIADGVHVHPAMLRLLIKLLGPERTIVITDALAGAGVPDATFEFAGQHAHVDDGVARLEDGTITGSVLTLDQALRNVLEWTDLPLHEAVGLLTSNPARAAGAATRKGLLASGYDADLLIFDGALTLQATICKGTLAYVREEWRERLGGLVAVEAPSVAS